jgi:hypothetical protein
MLEPSPLPSPTVFDEGSNGAPKLVYLRGALLFLAATLLYYFTRSPALDEMDSVQFAMGVQGFNLWKHHPHPPGYPLYIFLGWVGTKLFTPDPALWLHVVSCVGGGLLVACWFLIVRMGWKESLAWIFAVALAVTPGIWLTSTKVLTDSLAAGLLSFQVLCSLHYLRGQTRPALLGMALAGAAATGARPQFFGIVLLMLCFVLFQKRAAGWEWGAGLVALVFSCLLWLIPMWVMQARLSKSHGFDAYPYLLLKQFRWRLDKPTIYVGAGDGSWSYWGERINAHLGGWFWAGFGFTVSTWILVAAVTIFTLGIVLYARRFLAGRTPWERLFWRTQWPWAAAYVAMIFCFLPADPRYYCAIFPLILLPVVAGWWSLPGFWRLGRVAVPALLLCASFPLVKANHTVEPPPVQMIRYLQQKHPPSERPQVWLFMDLAKRHAEWYGSDFAIAGPKNTPTESDILKSGKPVYTDDADLLTEMGWQGLTLTLEQTFERSNLVHRKHSKTELFRIEPQPAK